MKRKPISSLDSNAYFWSARTLKHFECSVAYLCLPEWNTQWENLLPGAVQCQGQDPNRLPALLAVVLLSYIVGCERYRGSFLDCFIFVTQSYGLELHTATDPVSQGIGGGDEQFLYAMGKWKRCLSSHAVWRIGRDDGANVLVDLRAFFPCLVNCDAAFTHP